MKYISVVVLIFTTEMLNTYNAKEEDSLEPTSILFNFTDPQTTAFENWIEVSDAILIGGRSKATIVPLNGTVNVAYKYNVTNIIVFRITNRHYCSIYSIHEKMDRVSLVSTGNWILRIFQNIQVL